MIFLITIVSIIIGTIFGYWLRARIDFCVSAVTGRKILKVLKIHRKTIKELENLSEK